MKSLGDTKVVLLRMNVFESNLTNLPTTSPRKPEKHRNFDWHIGVFINYAVAWVVLVILAKWELVELLHVYVRRAFLPTQHIPPQGGGGTSVAHSLPWHLARPPCLPPALTPSFSSSSDFACPSLSFCICCFLFLLHAHSPLHTLLSCSTLGIIFLGISQCLSLQISFLFYPDFRRWH